MNDNALRRYETMCLIVGDAVFSLVSEGHETRRAALADMLRTEMLKHNRYDPNELQAMNRAVRLLESNAVQD
ncbi:DUF2767 family protein [Pantoea sp. B270]|uniref:DUF2767 family protein n=1 Tax=Pantoea sp. B270 TaxID=2836826 RepID=UPI001BFFB3A0|nr:DUF2767 family protein [Pantoea sp. B270]MBU6520789.1 DUF2767 family protein [Pantoea sp. B270]